MNFSVVLHRELIVECYKQQKVTINITVYAGNNLIVDVFGFVIVYCTLNLCVSNSVGFLGSALLS